MAKSTRPQETTGGETHDPALDVAGKLFLYSMRVARTADQLRESVSPARIGISTSEFTEIVNESLYLLIAWCDLEAFQLLGARNRGPFMDQLLGWLNHLLADEQLTRSTKYERQTQLEPRIWVASFDLEKQNARSAQYTNYWKSNLHFEGALSAFTHHLRAKSLACTESDLRQALMESLGPRFEELHNLMKHALRPEVFGKGAV